MGVRISALAAILVFILVAVSCGGKNSGELGLNGQATNPGGRNDSTAEKGTGVVVHESDIASLPRWQQEMLADPGWNQPYIPPARPTIIEAPTTEMLNRLMREKREANVTASPRGFSPAGKSASWIEFPPPLGDWVLGEYDGVAPSAIPPFGCNSDGSNSNDGNAIEDVIGAYGQPVSQNSTGVFSGSSSQNYFCPGGSGNDMFSMVGQVFADGPDWMGLYYNAGLINGPIGPGGSCPAEAFRISDYIWRRFNSETIATPFLNPTVLHNLLIAPKDNIQGPVDTSGGSVAWYQPFYFGSVGRCYGDAWIVSIESEIPIEQDFYTNPVYGLLLKRWQDMSAEGTPWASEFGVPVFGPFAYAGGSPQLNNKGQYYAWGMVYEKGFMWWVDYDNDGPGAAYPNATDEAVAYSFTGGNILQAIDGEYLRMPTVFYGGQGRLGANVVVQGQREEDEDPWEPVEFTGTQYKIALGDDGNYNPGLNTMTLNLFAQGNGGTPDVDCNYKYYVWSLRNGSIISAGAPFDPAQRFATATYGSDIENREGVYVVRVQVTDADDNLAYGDSFPIHVGHSGDAWTSYIPVVIIDNDPDDLWPTNLEA